MRSIRITLVRLMSSHLPTFFWMLLLHSLMLELYFILQWLSLTDEWRHPALLSETADCKICSRVARERRTTAADKNFSIITSQKFRQGAISEINLAVVFFLSRHLIEGKRFSMSPKKIPMMKNKLGVKNKSERTKHDDAFIF